MAEGQWTIRERNWEKAIPLGHELDPSTGTWWLDTDLSPEEIILCAAEVQILAGHEEELEGVIEFEVTRPDGQSRWWHVSINLPEAGLELESAWLSPGRAPSQDWYASIAVDFKQE